MINVVPKRKVAMKTVAIIKKVILPIVVREEFAILLNRVLVVSDLA